MSGVPLCPGCHCTQGATAIRYHCVQGATMPRISPCLGCHHAQGATVTRVPLCPGCHHVQDATMARVPPCPGCHHHPRARGRSTGDHRWGCAGVRGCWHECAHVPACAGVCRVCGAGGCTGYSPFHTPLPVLPHSPPQPPPVPRSPRSCTRRFASAGARSPVKGHGSWGGPGGCSPCLGGLA